MAFQPFGYPFEIRSTSSAAGVKAAIRKAATSWFDGKNGARGWIIGPFMCLWFSAYDQYGPMVLASIVEDRSGTRIRGRAGSDLNGMIVLVLFGPIAAAGILQMLASGGLTGWRAVLIGGLVLLMPLGLWWAHADRREADPLVRFLHKVTPGAGQTTRRTGRVRQAASHLSLNLCGDNLADPVTDESIERALMRVGARGFVVLAAAPEVYIQAASENGHDFLIEHRDGSAQRHFKAIRARPLRKSVLSDRFSFDEVVDALTAYAAGTAMPRYMIWTPTSV